MGRNVEVSIDAPDWLALRLKAYLCGQPEGHFIRQAVHAFPIRQWANDEMWCPACRRSRWFAIVNTEKHVQSTMGLTVVRGVPAQRCLACRQVFDDVQIGALLEEEVDGLPGGEVGWETLLQPKGPASLVTIGGPW